MSRYENMALLAGFFVKEIFGDGIVQTGQNIIQYMSTRINEDRNINNRNISVYQPVTEEEKYRLIRQTVPGRTLDSMVLPHETEQIIKIVNHILNTRPTNGIPNRVGVLLHGPPGNGKSQFVSALATEFNVPLTIITLSTILLSNNNVIPRIFSSFARKSIVLIEDADSVFNNSSSPYLPIDTLLSGIDGAYVPPNIIYIMSCNTLDNIPQKLLRRFPHIIEFNYPTPETSLLLFEKYFQSATDDEKTKFLLAFSLAKHRNYHISFSDLEACFQNCNYLSPPEQINEFINSLLEIKVDREQK